MNYEKLFQSLKIEADADLLSGIRDIPHEVYHDPKCPGISRSAILKILQSPKHYQEWLRKPDQATAKMEFGAAVHAAILEPEEFAKRYTHYPVSEQYEGRSKAALQAREEFEKAHHDKQILKFEDFQLIEKIMESVHSCIQAKDFLKGLKEKTIFARESESGILCKVRPDLLLENDSIIDLKVTGDASRSGFIRSAAQLNYHIQAAFYLDALGLQKFHFLCVEDHEPFDVAIYEMDIDSLELGRKQYKRALMMLKNAQEKKEWKGYPKVSQLVRLPQWKFYDEENL